MRMLSHSVRGKGLSFDDCVSSFMEIIIIDYFLEDVIQMIRFLPPANEAKKRRDRDHHDDEGEEVTEEVP